MVRKNQGMTIKAILMYRSKHRRLIDKSVSYGLNRERLLGTCNDKKCDICNPSIEGNYRVVPQEETNEVGNVKSELSRNVSNGVVCKRRRISFSYWTPTGYRSFSNTKG